MRASLALVLVSLAACSRTPPEPSGSASAPASGVASESASALAPAPQSASASASNLALQWDDPPRWQRRKPSTSMRAAEWVVPRAPGDTEDAECFAITFGPGKGGSVADNVERWVKQFDPQTSPPARTTRAVHGMTVTRVEVAGTYKAMQMPGAPPTSPHGSSRLIGAIVEAPSGTWFFKLTGSDATVKAASKEMDALVDSMRPRG